VVWLALFLFAAGNVAGWANWIVWGPGQTDPKNADWRLVHASAFVFWLAAAMLVVIASDLVSMWRNRGIRPPTYEDLLDVDDWRIWKLANAIRRRAAQHQAVLGLFGLCGGALLGHYFWKP
jgi:hypothetical protein